MEIDISLFIRKIIPFLKKWENFILGAIDILAITLGFQCSYSINSFHLGGGMIKELKERIRGIGAISLRFPREPAR